MAPPKTKTTMVKATDNTLETVNLIGASNEIRHEHTLYFEGRYIDFIDGIATVPATLADILRRQGLVK